MKKSVKRYLLLGAFFGALISFISLGVSIMVPDKALDVSASDLWSSLQSKEDIFILDVREPREFRMGHIEGAVLIPLALLPSHLEEVPKDKPIFVYCRSGNRSSFAADFLRKQGFDSVHNLEGGMQAWQSACSSMKRAC